MGSGIRQRPRRESLLVAHALTAGMVLLMVVILLTMLLLVGLVLIFVGHV